MKRLAILVTLIFLSLSTQVRSDDVALVGAESGKWTMDYDAAEKLAKEKELPMLLNFTGSDWCGWCKLMDKNVFAGEAWKTFAKDQVVLVTVDFPRDPLKVPPAYQKRNNALKEKFQIQGYPSYVVLDSDAETVLGQLGAGREKTPESFVEEFKQVQRFSKASIQAYVEANPDKAEAYKAALSSLKEVENELKEWIGTRPQQTEENNKKYADFMSRIEAAVAKVGEFN